MVLVFYESESSCPLKRETASFLPSALEIDVKIGYCASRALDLIDQGMFLVLKWLRSKFHFRSECPKLRPRCPSSWRAWPPSWSRCGTKRSWRCWSSNKRRFVLKEIFVQVTDCYWLKFQKCKCCWHLGAKVKMPLSLLLGNWRNLTAPKFFLRSQN